jgi:hypothetical protein
MLAPEARLASLESDEVICDFNPGLRLGDSLVRGYNYVVPNGTLIWVLRTKEWVWGF